jgi:hypothetical protein
VLLVTRVQLHVLQAMPLQATPDTAWLLHCPGFLLELASVVAGVGLTIHEAVVQGSGDGLVPQQASHDASRGRTFVFWVTNSKDSSKLVSCCH